MILCDENADSANMINAEKSAHNPFFLYVHNLLRLFSCTVLQQPNFFLSDQLLIDTTITSLYSIEHF
jgi:hypothetical protein